MSTRRRRRDEDEDEDGSDNDTESDDNNSNNNTNQSVGEGEEGDEENAIRPEDGPRTARRKTEQKEKETPGGSRVDIGIG